MKKLLLLLCLLFLPIACVQTTASPTISYEEFSQADFGSEPKRFKEILESEVRNNNFFLNPSSLVFKVEKPPRKAAVALQTNEKLYGWGDIIQINGTDKNGEYVGFVNYAYIINNNKLVWFGLWEPKSIFVLENEDVANFRRDTEEFTKTHNEAMGLVTRYVKENKSDLAAMQMTILLLNRKLYSTKNHGYTLVVQKKVILDDAFLKITEAAQATGKILKFGKKPSQKNAELLVSENLKSKLKDPDSAQFQFVPEVIAGWDIFDDTYIYGWKVTGLINAKNSYGGYVGFKPFVAYIKNGQVLYSMMYD